MADLDAHLIMAFAIIIAFAIALVWAVASLVIEVLRGGEK